MIEPRFEQYPVARKKINPIGYFDKKGTKTSKLINTYFSYFVPGNCFLEYTLIEKTVRPDHDDWSVRIPQLRNTEISNRTKKESSKRRRQSSFG